jgi:protein-disulfide isomerase
MDHVRGLPDARVTLIEYGDFECPTCKQAARAVALLWKRLDGRVRLVYRHFPLTGIHPNAWAAAEASEAAGAQGQFWAMHDRLFDNQLHLDVACLRRLAGSLGLDVRRFERELESHTHMQRVRGHAVEGQRLGIRTSPAFFVNGALCDVSFGLSRLRHAVNEALCGAAGRSYSAPAAQ